jgi:hypothetical protein
VRAPSGEAPHEPRQAPAHRVAPPVEAGVARGPRPSEADPLDASRGTP